MLDMYDFNNDIWLCHSAGGKCYNFAAFVSASLRSNIDLIFTCMAVENLFFNFNGLNVIQQPASKALKEVEAFLNKNPSEIVTIFIEDYVTSSKGLSKVFDAAGLRKYWFPVEKMPKDGSDWPTVDDMVKKNERLVVFTSKSTKEDSEGIAYEWRYVVENQCEF